jgi:hypothetical protein
VRFCIPGVERPFWSAVARSSDGARFAVLDGAHPRFTDELRDEARAELAGIAGAAADPDAVPALAFAKLIWPPYRERVLGLMARLLDRVHGRVGAGAPGAARGGP